ncbi:MULTISPECIES: NAD(P)/FAD-dependent oxidoreductase [unclassified Aureimonas]|uniref:NAD(P)/FAD-dependent oxidoreductase n=1 Tax=unclassified Aureimonas TaxID=2615206 RepID=UPI0006FFE46B|nr:MULTISPECIES: FAD-binding oxidoreductase [unclassified Aureimonas]KQT52982.1 FAD-dependent oxidoreductase [Aureimonas sp. Leaf427]KQT80441.1 FAD-dependent oxidoreductase [Aureimonas sp. Leaf460]
MAANTVVIGGGIVGLSSALALQRAGVSTLVVDSGGPDLAASWGNAGHIAIEQVAPLASFATIRSAPRRLTIAGGALSLPLRDVGHWLPFALRLARASTPDRYRHGAAILGGLLADAMPAWRRLAASLPGESILKEEGHIVVWHDPRAAARGVEAWTSADIGTARLRVATPAERQDLGRLMAVPPAGALIFENTAQVSSHAALREGLLAAFRAAGGQMREDRVRGLTLRGTRAVLALASGETLEPARVLLAAGVQAGQLLEPLGTRVPIIAERGYHIESPDHGWPEGTPPVVFEDRSMIVTRFSAGLRAASFVEFTGPRSQPDPRRWRTLERHVRELGLPLRGTPARWAGARPTLPDYLPAIGRSEAADNLFYAFGHQHLGLTLGPITGELVSSMMAGPGLPADLASALSLERFAPRNASRV